MGEGSSRGAGTRVLGREYLSRQSIRAYVLAEPRATIERGPGYGQVLELALKMEYQLGNR